MDLCDSDNMESMVVKQFHEPMILKIEGKNIKTQKDPLNILIQLQCVFGDRTGRKRVIWISSSSFLFFIRLVLIEK